MDYLRKLIKSKNARLFFLVVILVFLFNATSSFYLIVGDSMDPSKKNLELALVDKVAFNQINPKEGDIIVFYIAETDEFLIKRVIGVPGDEIQIIDGYIYKNGFLYIDEFSHINITNGTTWRSDVLGDGEYWVIGDNRDDTWWGIVFQDEIIGKLVF
tara:strand:+ start:3009 stop:3479 length:471 start_codon:yes stop_codon:yes gene_type:complete